MNYYLFLSVLSIFVLLSCYLIIGKNKNEINIICSAIFTILFTLTVFYLVETPIIEGNTIKIKMEGGDKIESIAKSIFKPDITEDVRINVVNNHRGMAIPKPIVSEYTQLNTDELTNEEADKLSCVDRAKAQYGDKITNDSNSLISGDWNDRPRGCSVQSEGDWAAYWNDTDGTNDGNYSKIGDWSSVRLIANGVENEENNRLNNEDDNEAEAAAEATNVATNVATEAAMVAAAAAPTEPVVPVPPTEAGCYVLNKDGCPKKARHNKPGEWIKTNSWNDANKSDEKCENRIKNFNWECGVKTFQHHFNPT